jgi:hypothetical protein
MEPVLKTGGCYSLVGSNPTPSAKYVDRSSMARTLACGARYASSILVDHPKYGPVEQRSARHPVTVKVEGSNPFWSAIYSHLAQLVERLAVNEDVAGSSPAVGAKLKFFC